MIFEEAYHLGFIDLDPVVDGQINPEWLQFVDMEVSDCD